MINLKKARNFADLITIISLLILATILLTCSTGFFYKLIALLTKNAANQSDELLVRALMKLPIGAFLGSVIGIVGGFILATITPKAKSGILSIDIGEINKWISFYACFLICWFFGILAGAIKGGIDCFYG